MLSLETTTKKILSEYKNKFDIQLGEIKYLTSPQIVDGSIMQFVEDKSNKIIATAKMRFTNNIKITKDTTSDNTNDASGNAFLQILFSDIVLHK